MANYDDPHDVCCWQCGKDYNTTEHEYCPKCGTCQHDEPNQEDLTIPRGLIEWGDELEDDD